MDVQSKLRILADAAKYDASCASSGAYRKRPEGGIGNAQGMGICHSYTPDGRCVSLLKILLTNYCIYDCTYCVNRISSDIARARFTADEVVTLTMEFYKRNYIEGLFLSSGVIQSPDYTMEQLVLVAKSLREEHKYGGYLHLKAVPGASIELMLEAGKWSDRLSANIEMATQTDLNKLAPAKTHKEIEVSMAQIRHGILSARDMTKRDGAKPAFAAGQSTQMVVGATDTADSEVLKKASTLYRVFQLRRVYYSGFSPFPKGDPRLPLQQTPLVREHRLYQADWLMRFYGFKPEELVGGDKPNLSLTIDPKLDWALRHREFFPLDINKASKAALLRVPGFGVRNVSRILQIRKYRALTLSDLAKLKVAVARAKFFVVTSDHNPSLRQLDELALPQRVAVPEQLGLFDAQVSARTGEL